MNSNVPRDSRRPSPTKTLVLFASVGSAALFLAGCGRKTVIVQSPPPTVIQQAPAAAPATPAPTGIMVIREAPPPPRYEAPPPAPSGDYTWVPGYWSAADGRPQWVAGHYETPPHPGATWMAPRWEKRGDGYVFTPGFWQ